MRYGNGFLDSDLAVGSRPAAKLQPLVQERPVMFATSGRAMVQSASGSWSVGAEGSAARTGGARGRFRGLA